MIENTATAPPVLHRHFGLTHAIALNVSMIVGAGVFITIPLMLAKAPGPYAIFGWVLGGLLMLVDGLIWSELGAMLPGSGGSYVFLLESYGPRRWGPLMAFLYVWQFLISGPLEIASGLIAMTVFVNGLDPATALFNERWTWSLSLGADLGITIGPTRIAAFCIGVLILFLLYRRITTLGRLTVTIFVGVLAALAWILVEGFARFDPAIAFMPHTRDPQQSPALGRGMGEAMLLAMYSYLGYYNVCHMGDEVRDPGRNIPRAILASALLVCLLFTGVHLAFLGAVPWTEVPLDKNQLENYSLPAEFMRRVHGEWAAVLVTVLLVWSCFGAAYAGLLGYSRVPFGAAYYGHFFAGLARVHPVHRIPHLSLLLVGGLTLFWLFFDLESVITALIVTRIPLQFMGQIVGLIILRRRQPDRPRPFRIWFYPVPCALALGGWLYLYVCAERFFIVLGLITLLAGVVAFLVWTWFGSPTR